MYNQKFFSNLTLNLHFIDKCNMGCRFCFACKSSKQTLFNYKLLLDKCATFGRINFVGGEPTLAVQLPQMVDYAISLGQKTSIVTNGFSFVKADSNNFSQNNNFYKNHLINTFSKMQTVGLSVDSLDRNINLKIGRHVGKRTLSKDDIINFCKTVKSLGVELKLNTVVNRYNLDEDFTELLNIVEPSRWKVFQVMPTSNQIHNEEFSISKAEFENFVKNHKQFENIMYVENNELIKNSYIMINADGYFMNTAPYTVLPHQKSLYEEETNMLEEFLKVDYNIEKYKQRYEKIG